MNEINYSELDSVEVVPEASSMIESFRSVGYSLETAIADIVDNSISAGAKNVYINSEWRGDESFISILDDGKGMNKPQLIEAMRPGSKNPLSERSPNDLGRFGLGLKTASFSQCRRLTVISKALNYNTVFLTWDLDFVGQTGKWSLLDYCPTEFIDKLNELQSGTMVVWSCMDRIVPPNTSIDDGNCHKKFLSQMDSVRKHLSMTFHRFIEDNNLKIYGWGVPLLAWNPFLISESATQGFASQSLGNGAVVKGFVLPHKDKLSDDKFIIGEGSKGWNEQQGFYVYRNKRLLLAGDWLGLGHPKFRKEEHSKLARIQIDIPNTIDSNWQIDIKKSSARPPLSCIPSLESYAKTIRSRAIEVYRHRGKVTQVLPGTNFQPFWLEKKKGDKWSFVVNRDHIVIQEIKKMIQTKPDKAIETLLKFVEETIPTKSVFIKESEDAEKQSMPFENINKDLIIDMIKSIANSLESQGKPIAFIKNSIINMEPFNRFPELVESILEKYDR